MKPVIQKIGIDAQVILSKLEKLNIGDFIPYNDLGTAIGSTVDGSSGALSTARNRLLRDSSIVFGTVRGEGLKRLSDSEKIKVAYSKVESIKRTSHRGLLLAQSVNPDELEKDDNMKLNLTISHLGVLAHASSTKAGKKIEQKVISNNGLVPAGIGLDSLK